MFEYEKKVMLTKDEYNYILMMCKNVSKQTQTNYYFDNDEMSMNKKGITCRIREKDGIYKATVKNHNAEHPDCSMEIDLEEKTEFNPQIFNVFGFYHKGKFVTDRFVIWRDATYEMVLDCNMYLGFTDFELEVEYCKEGERLAQTLIEYIAQRLVAAGKINDIDGFLARVGQGGSKSQRFFGRLINLK